MTLETSCPKCAGTGREKLKHLVSGTLATYFGMWEEYESSCSRCNGKGSLPLDNEALCRLVESLMLRVTTLEESVARHDRELLPTRPMQPPVAFLQTTWPNTETELADMREAVQNMRESDYGELP